MPISQETWIEDKMRELDIPSDTIGHFLNCSRSLVDATLNGKRPNPDRLTKIYDLVKRIDKLAQRVDPLKLDFHDPALVGRWLVLIDEDDIKVVSGSDMRVAKVAATALEVLTGRPMPIDASPDEQAKFFEALHQ